MRALSKFSVVHAVLIYAAIRVLSFVTWQHPLSHQIIAGTLILGFASLCYKKISLAWVALVGELLLDGSGHFFEFHGLLLRTWFLGIFAVVWCAKTFVLPPPRRGRQGEGLSESKNANITINPSADKTPPSLPGPALVRPVCGPPTRVGKIICGIPKNILIALSIFSIFLTISIANGFINNHNAGEIIQDAILYLFLLITFPAMEMDNLRTEIVTLAKGYIVGSALFSFITLCIYSSGLGTLPDAYYHWFRNVAAGKITDLGNHFFRIVLPEHLLIIPAILILKAYIIKDHWNKNMWFYTIASSFILILNFSRIYFLGLATGFIVLSIKEHTKHWFRTSILISTALLVLFTGTFFITSRGHSFGLELLGIRAVGVAAPSSDVSGAIRMALLPQVITIIKAHPLLGSGLGTTVTFIHPISKLTETRTQFDWGYFEQWAELGILGLLSYIALLGAILYDVARRAYRSHAPLLRGLLAGAAALFVINITTPAIFQGFGVLYFVFILIMSKRDPT